MAKLKLRREPRKQVTGTSYAAKGAETPAPTSYSEIGSQTASTIRDIVPELATKFQQAQTYKKMVRSDASVRSSLRAGKSPVLGAEFFVQPFDESEESLVIKEFCEFNLFEAPSIPWLRTISDILTMFEQASAVLEAVYELREWAPKKVSPSANRRKYTMLRKLALRPSSTIEKFTYDDNGGPTGIIQNAINAKGEATKKTIPIEKLLIFTFEGEGGNLEGESILRSSYQNWFYKNTLYKIDAIQKERHGIGVPDIEIQAGASDADKKLAHEMGRNLRTNEFSYIVRPPTLIVGFAELKGNLVNALESANHHDNQIMKNILVQFLNLGLESSGGGRATGATAADMFLKAMSYVANYICDTINLYLFPRLVAYNFATDNFPKLQVRNIGETKDFQMWTSGISNLLDSNAITWDFLLEQHIRRAADLPLRLTEPTQDERMIEGRLTKRTEVEETEHPDGKGVNRESTGNIGKADIGGD